MERRSVLTAAIWLAVFAVSATGPAPGYAGESREERVNLGLKEALELGTGKAVDLTGRVDGYFKNKAIKLQVPPQLRSLDQVLRAVGKGDEVDDLVLAMNRAAERAVPAARPIFREAIREMTFADAGKILTSKDAAATAYFKEKATGRLTRAFRPIVAQAMDEEAVTHRYQELLDRVPVLPFGGKPSLDLEKYVVSKSLDGLFYMVAQEEKEIRKNPAARVTNLLQEVFGRASKR